MKLKRFEDGHEDWDTTIIVPVNSHKKKWWKLSLIFAFIFMICILIIVMRYYNSNSYIFKEYYAIENVMPTTRGQSEQVEAVVKFEKREFNSSSEIFKKIIEKDSTNIAAVFYYGISNIEIEKYNESIKSFKYIIDNNDNIYTELSKWYLALCYLKCGEKDKSIEIFEKISLEKDNYYSNDAKKILQKLK